MGIRRLGLLLLLTACGDVQSSELDVEEIGENGRDWVQGCAWREGKVTEHPPRPTGCYQAFVRADSRVSTRELAPCQAARLPHCITLQSGQRLFGYFDRELRPDVNVQVFKSVATLADGTCEPCLAEDL